MDTNDLDYLEKRGLDHQPVRISSNLAPHRPRQHHTQLSRLSREGICGISVYGLILLAFLTFASLVFFGLAHGFWHLCVHYAAKETQYAHHRPHVYH